MFERLIDTKNKLFSADIAIPESLQATHLPGLDGLRGFSILVVILSHLLMYTPYTQHVVGSIGVWIFFVISGFLITSLLLKEKVSTGSISLKQFYVRRCLRIIPVAYLFLLAVKILNHFYKLGIDNSAFLSSAFFARNLTFTGKDNWYVAHFWSLATEEQFYVTFPFLLVYDLKKYTKTIIVIIVIVPVIELLGFNKVGIFYTNHTVHIIAFTIINLLGNTVNILIGSLLSILLFKQVIVIRQTPERSYLSLLLFITAILLCTYGHLLGLSYMSNFVFPSLIGLVIILNLNVNSVLTKIFNNQTFTYFGVLSYSLYIWQQLFTSSRYHIFNTDSVFIRIIVLFTIANLSYFFYERFFLKLKKRYVLKSSGQNIKRAV